MNPPEIPDRGRRTAAAAAVFCLCLLTHLPYISSPILDHHAWAQTLRASIARNYVRDGMNFFHPRVDFQGNDPRPAKTQFPLYSYAVAAAYRLFGENDSWGRAVSALFGGLSAVALYVFARSLVGEGPALFAALAYCAIPLRVYFMRAVMPESMAIFFLLVCLHSSRRWSQRGDFFPWGLSACAAGAMAPLLKLPYLMLLLPVPAVFLERDGWGFLRKKEAWIFSGSALAAVAAWYGHIVRGAGTLMEEKGLFLGEMDWLGQWTSLGFWTTHFLSRFPELLTTYPGLVFFFAGGWACWKAKDGRRGPETRFLGVWLAATAAYIVLCGKYGRVHQYASLPFAPVNAVFIGAGIALLKERWGKSRALTALLWSLVLAMPVHASLRIRHWYRSDDLWVFRAASRVAEVSGPDDLFYVNSQDQPIALYHIRRRGFVGRLTPSLDRLEWARGNGARFLLAPTHVPEDNWAEVGPVLDRKFRVLVRDPDFTLYELGREKG